jgi:hypothetical protein
MTRSVAATRVGASSGGLSGVLSGVLIVGLIVGLFGGAFAIGSVAHAQELCVPGALGTALPLDGTPVLVEAREIELRGTIDSLHDGAVLDAFARRSDGRTFVAEGPFVALPPGSELVHEDLATHGYRVRLPPGGPHLVAFAIGRVGAAQLRTRSEVLADLRGAITLCAIREPALVVGEVVMATPTPEVRGSRVPIGVLFGGLGAALALGFALAWFRARSREAWPRLVRRAARAVRAVDREVTRLGPAFSPVAAQSREVHDAFEQVRAHATELVRAAARIDGEGREAATRREALRADADVARARAEALVDRLEATAAALAAELAEQHRAHDVDERASRLGRELELAVGADREARAEALR